MPRTGLTPALRAASYMGSAPYMLPWSVIPTAGWPSAAAAATTSPIRDAPSSIEYSVCRCRCTNESPTLTPPTSPGPVDAPVDAPVDEPVENHTPVIRGYAAEEVAASDQLRGLSPPCGRRSARASGRGALRA